MGILKSIFRNGFAAIFSQAILVFIQLVQRMVLIRYIGVELLGINSTISSVLNALALTELGVQSAVVFYLYQPLKEKDTDKINGCLNVLRIFYNCLAVFLFILALICIPFLGKLLNGVIINEYIIFMFLLMAGNISVSYVIAYQRALFYADRREYICKIADSITQISFFLIKILVLLITENFLLFLFVQILQSFSGNLFISVLCKRKYPFLKKGKADIVFVKKIWGDVKNIFSGKFAGYIYGATDNIIISMRLNPTVVGFFTNYTLITSSLKAAVSIMFNSMTPIIGNMIVYSGEKKQEELFEIYSKVRFIIANCLVIPWLILAGDIVSFLFGKQYVLEMAIPILLSIDMYIHVAYSGCCEYINGAGLFREDKNVAVLGALINIVSSYILCGILGIEGVLIGTVLSQIFFWGIRSKLVYGSIFGLNIRAWFIYWFKNVVEIAYTIIISGMLYVIKKRMGLVDSLPVFILSGIGIEVISLGIYFLAFGHQREMRILFQTILKRAKEKLR